MNLNELQHIKPMPRNPNPRSEDSQLWRASGLSNCLRVQLLGGFGLSLPRTSSFERFMSIRTGAHDKVLEWIRENYAATSTEFRVMNKELRCGGSIDSIIHDGDDKYLIDVKTSGKFVKTKDKPYWLNQIGFYTHCLQELHPKYNIVTLVLQVDFEGNITVLQPELNNEFMDVLNLLNIYWDSGTLPDINSCMFNDCAKCSLKNVCTEPMETLNEFVELTKKELCSYTAQNEVA